MSGGHDGSDVATPGRWRLLLGDRRLARATTVAPVEDTVDPVALALQQMLDNAENRLLGVRAKTEAILGRLSTRRHWAGMTLDEVLKAVMDEVLEVYGIALGKAK